MPPTHYVHRVVFIARAVQDKYTVGINYISYIISVLYCTVPECYQNHIKDRISRFASGENNLLG